MTRALSGLLLLLATTAAYAGDAPKLDAKSQKKWLGHVVPSEKERAWREIGWHARLWQAVVEAHEAKKPILLWAMNGHALGCT